MSKSKTEILPATGHNLWVAWYDASLFEVPKSEDELMLILEVEPVIGWLYRTRKRRGEPLLEVTPFGRVERGLNRFRGESQDEARDAGMASLRENWKRYRSQKENSGG